MGIEPQQKPSIRMSDQEIWDFVRDAHTGVLTTLKGDGSPVSLPTWFALLDRSIYVRTRGKKLLRIKNNPVSAFLVEDGELWSELRGVQMNGHAEIIEVSPELKERFLAETERKYARYRTSTKEMPVSSQHAYSGMTLMCFTPEGKVLNWNNRGLAVR